MMQISVSENFLPELLGTLLMIVALLFGYVLLLVFAMVLLDALTKFTPKDHLASVYRESLIETDKYWLAAISPFHRLKFKPDPKDASWLCELGDIVKTFVFALAEMACFLPSVVVGTFIVAGTWAWDIIGRKTSAKGRQHTKVTR